jgi:NAD(P)-dependent dehydrogenase (short-subunit alcohol dehydrogenase family)
VFVQGGMDLTDAVAAGAAIDAAADHFGGLDALLNIAGGFRWETLQTSMAESWHKLFLMNVQTAANASRAATPYLRKSQAGRIVNVGANAALKASLGMGPYAASKAGVHSLTQALAEELKADGVTVNAVLPSILDTPANRVDMPKADFSAWVAPDDLASVMLFLASEEARAVTGALIPVTGRV